MKTAELKATIRENIGAKSAAKSRKQDRIPAVIYGESGVQHIEVDYLPMAKLIKSSDMHLINIDSGKEQRRVIIQDAQFHPVTDKILHVDFLEAAAGKTAKLNLPVKIVGTSIGVLNGGQFVLKSRHLHVKGVPAELPEYVEVDITNLAIGKSIKVSDIKGLEIIEAPNTVIARVKTARALEEVVAPVAEGAGAAEGEEGEKEEGEGEEAKEEKSE